MGTVQTKRATSPALSKVGEIIEEIATEQPNVGAIVEETLAKVREDADLHSEFADAAMVYTTREMAHQIQSRMRKAAEHNCRPGAASLRADCTKELQEFWTEYTVLGQALRDVTKETLLTSADHKENQAHGKLRRATFERRIADPLDEDSAVCDHWTNEEIEELASDLLNGEE